MQNLLEINNLKITTLRGKSTVRLLDKVDLSIRKKCSFGIVGESGCGKSITANAILGLLPYPLRVSEGSIRYDSKAGEMELLKLDRKQLREVRGQEISMIFQEPMTSLDPIFTVEMQMYEALSFHHPHMTKAEMREKSLDMLRQVNIPRPEQTLASYPHQLSGGQLQRIMIAIALINDPRLLLADEPTTALDVTIQAQILRLMNDLKERNDTSIIMITHDLGVIAETCEEVAVFYAGQIVEQANVVELFKQTAHPYTQGLLQAVTSLGGESRKLYTIPGIVPPGGQWAQGCRFSDRCSRCTEKCRQAMPALTEASPGHLCRCFLHSEEVEA
ncbi:MAG: ABC transporter ATP-binding protein [Clostridia bacterium]|nr:ABC transporter ATP-binding protein [Clostridia bacterium]